MTIRTISRWWLYIMTWQAVPWRMHWNYNEKFDFSSFLWESKVICVCFVLFCLIWVCINHTTLLRSSQNWSKTKTSRDSLVSDFLRFVSAARICFELWLVHWIIYLISDWSEWLLWCRFWCSGTHFKIGLRELKTAKLSVTIICPRIAIKETRPGLTQ